MNVNLGTQSFTQSGWRVSVELPSAGTDLSFSDKVFFYISHDSGSIYRHLSYTEAMQLAHALLDVAKEAAARHAQACSASVPEGGAS